MEYTWDLDVLYEGVESDKFKKDFASVDEYIAKVNALAESLSHDDEVKCLHEIVAIQNEMDEKLSALFEYLSFNMSTDSTNSTYMSLMGVLQMKLSATAKAQAVFEHFIAACDLEKACAADAYLKEHQYVLNKTKESSKHMLSEEVEEALSKLSINGSHAWGNLQEFLTSTVDVDYRGEKITLSAVRNLAYSDDAKERKDAYEAEIAAYDKIKESIAYSLNSIKGEVNTVCEMRGYESPLARSLDGNHMQQASLDAMFSAIDDYLPKFHAYLRRKAEVLGYENGLPWYELFAPMGKASTAKFSVEDAHAYLIENFKDFSLDMCEMIDQAFAERWIDFFPRKGKVGGAFCGGVSSLKQSRILTNFDGSLSDVVTLAHELGHAYHNKHSFHNTSMNSGHPMQLAETASTFNETVVMESAIKAAKDKDEKIKLLESKLSDETQVICDIYSRFLFEREVFEKRKDSFMHADDLQEIMLNAQKKAYGNGLDHTCLHPYMWCCKSHYYSTFSFYNFPYAFGDLFARGLYAKYQKEGASFVPGYQKLLGSCGLMDAEDVAMMANIDITDKAFWASSLESVAKMIDEFLELTK